MAGTIINAELRMEERISREDAKKEPSAKSGLGWISVLNGRERRERTESTDENSQLNRLVFFSVRSVLSVVDFRFRGFGEPFTISSLPVGRLRDAGTKSVKYFHGVVKDAE